jgi:hypothetical protein
MLGTNCLEQYALREASWNKWQKYANDIKDDEYELLILNYNANEDAFIAKK